MSETVALIANVSLTLSFVVALIFGVSQVKAAARDRRERLTLEALRNFQTREFAELMYFQTSRGAPQSQEELAKMPERERVMFTQFAQQMESLGLLVGEGFIDLDLVDKTLGSLVSNSWRKYEKLFKDMRQKQNDPFMAEYFQWLAEHIEDRLKNSPRTPYHLRKS